MRDRGFVLKIFNKVSDISYKSFYPHIVLKKSFNASSVSVVKHLSAFNYWAVMSLHSSDVLP